MAVPTADRPVALDNSNHTPAESSDVVTPASAYLGSWETEAADRIARERRAAATTATEDDQHQRPFMVAIAGIPGSGKTISSLLLQSLLEKNHGLASMICPHDGYHYPLEYLKTHFADADYCCAWFHLGLIYILLDNICLHQQAHICRSHLEIKHLKMT